MLETFFYHRKNGSALSVEDKKVVVNGRETLRMSTACSDVCCEWEDSSTQLVMLSNLKESCLIKIAEYAIA